MPIQTQEAPSVSRQQILQLIPQYEIKPIFLREHLNRELVIGTIGDRGGGKSGSDAVIAGVDYMIAGKSVWSNILIKFDIKIADETARKYGLNYGGVAHYESLPLEKSALLKLDETYRDGCLLIEEINVEYANARKALTNTNVEFNAVCQQLRKFKTSLLYNVIDEMFIDVQLRTLTDIFLKTYDTAFDLGSLSQQKQTGLDFHWSVYPMTGYLAGEQGKYPVTKKPMPPVFFHFGGWRGIYNDKKHQEKGIYSMSRKERDKAEMEAALSVESSPEMVEDMSEWGWLAEIAQALKADGVKRLQKHELANRIGTPLNREITDWLGVFGVHWDNPKQVYIVEDYDIGGWKPRPRKAIAT